VRQALTVVTGGDSRYDGTYRGPARSSSSSSAAPSGRSTPACSASARRPTASSR
jgi:hypothetical protein